MNERDAQEVIRMIEDQWSFDLGTARTLWRQQLVPRDAEIVTKAVVHLAKTMSTRPRLADLLEVVESMTPALPPADECQTCGGDLFVTVYTRKPETTAWMNKHRIKADSAQVIEEMAACPDCNPSDTSFYRQGGGLARALDPEKVRQLMSAPTFTDRDNSPPPEWVWVWSWARWYREPREERPFPQQAGGVDETEIMTMDEYAELLAEWKEAGSPKSRNPLPMYR